jgi:hypothetical protein
LPASTAATLVFNTGHLSELSLIQPGNHVLKSSELLPAGAVREFHLAEVKTDEGMSGGPVYLVETGEVIGIVHGYTHDPQRAVIVPARYAIELLKKNRVGLQSLPGREEAGR